MSRYTLTPHGVNRDDGASIPDSMENKDWVEYQRWLAEGNTPDPADPPPPPPVVYKEKNSIIVQIATAGKYDLAEIELLKLPNWQQALWHGAYKIASDDPMVRKLLTDIGMDAEAVMSAATDFGG